MARARKVPGRAQEDRKRATTAEERAGTARPANACRQRKEQGTARKVRYGEMVCPEPWPGMTTIYAPMPAVYTA